ncbi:MAG: methyl-accepting chemotaxis protein [Lachnospiraceae bacterium]|nr:methyl-accepting chemotaxis protein [Lachnospiraceae bacterium]
MLKKLKIREKLVVIFGLLLIITIFVQGALSFVELDKSHDSTIEAVEGEFDAIIKTSVDSIIGALDSNHQRYLNGEITQNEEMETAKKIVRDTRYNNGEGYLWADLEDGTCVVHMSPEQEGKNRFNLQDFEGTYLVQNILKEGNNPEGGFTEFYFSKVGEEGYFKKRSFTKKFEPYGWYISSANYYDDIEETIAAYEKDKNFALMGIIACGAVLSFLGIILMFIVANIITKHLNAITQRITKLCQGDLHSPVPEVNTGDELETLAMATSQTVGNLSMVIMDIGNSMKEFSEGNFVLDDNLSYIGDLDEIRSSIEKFVENISSSLLQINSSSEQVAYGSDQLSGVAQSLSQGATQQASSIEELSNVLGEITLKTKMTAENAENAKQISLDTGVAVSRSKQQMSEMTAAMDEISNTSNEIGKIIKNIDDIAFQTNILALNAAVEAARAGSAGKGFAVVADEVRNLAAKSAESAKSTAALIEKAINAIDNGTKIVVRTAESLDGVISASEKSAQAIQYIADESIEQEKAVVKVNAGVEEISAVVQTNSATAQESAATSEELSGQAQLLKNLISRFKLKK